MLRQELQQAERFGHVVVGPDAKTTHLVRLVAQCGENQYGSLVSAVSQLPENPITALIAQHEIEDDQIGRV